MRESGVDEPSIDADTDDPLAELTAREREHAISLPGVLTPRPLTRASRRGLRPLTPAQPRRQRAPRGSGGALPGAVSRATVRARQ